MRSARSLVDAHYPPVRLAEHEHNRGYGAAIRTGFGHARSNLVFYTDADNQFDLADLEHFLPLMSEYDAVVGFRVYRYDSVVRSIALVDLQPDRPRPVPGPGPRRRLRVQALSPRGDGARSSIECDDFFVDAELVAKARRWNFRILEKGVRHYPRMAGETTVRASDIPETLSRIALMWKRIHFPGRRHVDAACVIDRSGTCARRRGASAAIAESTVDLSSGSVEERFYEEYARIQERHWWFRGRREILAGELERRRSEVNGGPLILDIGCGTGPMLDERWPLRDGGGGRR